MVGLISKYKIKIGEFFILGFIKYYVVVDIFDWLVDFNCDID